MEGNTLATMRGGPDVQTSTGLSCSSAPSPLLKSCCHLCPPACCPLVSVHTAQSLAPPPGAHTECLYLSCHALCILLCANFTSTTTTTTGGGGISGQIHECQSQNNTCFAVEDGLECLILLPPPPEYWDYKDAHHSHIRRCWGSN